LLTTPSFIFNLRIMFIFIRDKPKQTVEFKNKQAA
jgi:hypothetical protein